MKVVEKIKIKIENHYLLKCFLNAPLTQYKATGFAQLFMDAKQNPTILNTCQNAL